MKKVKIFLTALTVLAVVGGALAFKAKKIDVTFGYCNPASGFCDLNTFKTKETTFEGDIQKFYDLPTKRCIPGETFCSTLVTTFD